MTDTDPGQGLSRSPRRRGTTTSRFGVSRRESHDASEFYDRFPPPEISDDAVVNLTDAEAIDRIYLGDARAMDVVASVAPSSVALVVTSPPYFAGKEYETAMGSGHVPGSYAEYLKMLRDVFAECKEKLEPGGRIAVNVANLGRKPYRSLSADVIRILQDDLRLLLRGEVIWVKGRAAGGSCAWGTFQRPGNPVLRDLSERVIIAGKGRFDRAVSPRERQQMEPPLPSDASIFADQFMDATTDVWELPPESATRVGHPAPFPVSLPERLIELYTYRGDLVLDPFMGSGSTAVAAVRTGRHYVGFDTDPDYIALADERIAAERAALAQRSTARSSPAGPVVIPPVADATQAADDADFQARAVREGRKAKDIARLVLETCGFTEIREDRKFRDIGIEVNFSAIDRAGMVWLFDVSGAFSSSRPGLRRTDTLWKAIGKAGVLHAAQLGQPLVLLTTDLPTPGSAGHNALKRVCGRDQAIRDVICLRDPDDQVRLARYALGDRP